MCDYNSVEIRFIRAQRIDVLELESGDKYQSRRGFNIEQLKRLFYVWISAIPNIHGCTRPCVCPKSSQCIDNILIFRQVKARRKV